MERVLEVSSWSQFVFLPHWHWNFFGKTKRPPTCDLQGNILVNKDFLSTPIAPGTASLPLVPSDLAGKLFNSA
jgi:hypothetical protein